MWSEKPEEAVLDRLAAAMREGLSLDEVPVSIGLRARPAPEQVAELLQERPGFVWLDGAATRHLLFCDPLAIVSSDDFEGPVQSLDGLQAALRAWPGALLAGWIGYEVAGELEDIDFGPDVAGALPRMQFGVYDSVLICGADGGWSVLGRPGAAEELLERAVSVVLPDLPDGPLSEGPVVSRNPFIAGVQNIVRRIHAGEFFQTNLCRHLEAPLRDELAWPLYRRLRALSPAEGGAYLRLDGGRAILSVSPETFLSVRGRTVESLPIKGTRRRGRTAGEDRALRAELLASAKDRAELAMVVDVTRNDLSRVCVPGTVVVAEHAALLTLPTLHHTYSRVTGRLRDGVEAADVLRAAFPPASITGAPKIAAVAAAYREEGLHRGPCMGSIGWIGPDRMELSVAIRTAYTGGDRVVYLAGCGITAESDAAAELAESEAKAAAFVAALGVLG